MSPKDYSQNDGETSLLDTDADWHGLFTSFDDDDVKWLRHAADILGVPDIDDEPAEAND